MSRSLSLMTALALVAGLSAATQCRDAQGHFAKCSAAAAAKPAKCRDAKGHYAKCSSAGASAMAAKTPPAAKPPTK